MTEPATSSTIEALLQEAQQHLEKGAVIKAMQIYYDLHERDPNSIVVLNRLVSINLHMQVYDQAIVNLQKLIKLQPLESASYDMLAKVYGTLEDWPQACETYYGLILRTPKAPDAHFNLAYYLRRAGKYQESIDSYQRALHHGISRPEEVHLNIAVIYADDLRKEDKAEEHLRQALAINASYLPALYNLANLYEDRGDREETVSLFQRMLAIEPDHPKALARLAPLTVSDTSKDTLVARLYDLGRSQSVSPSDKIDALYALGKTHNDCGEYDAAFDCYAAANILNAREMPAYDQAASEDYFQSVMDAVSAEWVTENRRPGDEQPVFICGMFRSGSTLLEQVLAAHSEITAGGERDRLVRELNRRDFMYPQGIERVAKEALHEIADRYLSQSKTLFPDAAYLTDKRPDNFLYVGLIKALFPKAKIIYTTRQPLDNCLSVYFVRLGQTMSYAVNLPSIAHYYDQQQRLLQHWQSIPGVDLHVVDYDRLIADPKSEIENVLNYLGLEWQDSCLEFHALRNTVKTASVWQVRQPLYATSSGRWRHYEKHIADLIDHFPEAATQVDHEQ